MTCPGCPHPPHAGRCFVVKDMAYCPCKHRAELPATIHSVGLKLDALTEACERYEARR